MMAAMLKSHKSMEDKFDIINKQIFADCRVKCVTLKQSWESDTPTLSVLVDQVEANSNRVNEIEELVSSVHTDTQQLRGIIQRQDKQITSLQNEVIELKAKLMANNIVITDVEDNIQGEKCTQSALDFLRDKIKMQVEENKVGYTFRQGIKIGRKPRPLIVRCSPLLRKRVFIYTKNQRVIKNSNNDYFYVNQQYPEQYAAERREHQDKMKQIKEKNKTLPPEQQVKVALKNKTLFINNEPQRKMVIPPSVADVLTLSTLRFFSFLP